MAVFVIKDDLSTPDREALHALRAGLAIGQRCPPDLGNAEYRTLMRVKESKMNVDIGRASRQLDDLDGVPRCCARNSTGGG